MELIKNFLRQIDERWEPIGEEPIALQIIGSAALMLQTDYQRGTQDSDVLESKGGSPKIKEQLLMLAGRGTDIHKQSRVYIDIVTPALLFLPQKAVFHPLHGLSLKNFRIKVLDITDVVISKLIRYSNDDANDIRAMAEKNHLDHSKLVARFEATADKFITDARADEMPRYLANFRKVERDILDVTPADITLPDSMQD